MASRKREEKGWRRKEEKKLLRRRQQLPLRLCLLPLLSRAPSRFCPRWARGEGTAGERPRRGGRSGGGGLGLLGPLVLGQVDLDKAHGARAHLVPEEEADLLDVLGQLWAAAERERRQRAVAHQRLEQQLRRDRRVVAQVEGRQGAVVGLGRRR